MSHDRCCPVQTTDWIDCVFCEALAAARSEEKTIASQTWRTNLNAIESRNYLDGYRDGYHHKPIPDWVAR